jgi:ElaB/YqjD/DUF883 family membrane-anchored ribosome-binding protein
MNENQLRGGAGPALAAHSKDASAPGQTPASEATGGDRGQAGTAGDTLGASVSDAARQTGDYVSEQSSYLTAQGTAFVREQPLLALALTGAVCLGLGFLLGRR